MLCILQLMIQGGHRSLIKEPSELIKRALVKPIPDIDISSLVDNQGECSGEPVTESLILFYFVGKF